MKFYGWNGKQTRDKKFTATVNGCGPAVKAGAEGRDSSRPSLTATATKHPDAPNMKELEVTLSDNLSLSSARLNGSLKFAGPHRFLVTGPPHPGRTRSRSGCKTASSGSASA